jgi:hypothetical protein
MGQSKLISMATAVMAAAAIVSFAPAANAATVIDDFSFTDASSAVLASGSFSYDSSLSSATSLTYADLSSFSITLGGQTFNTAFVQGLSPLNGDYVYFGFDPASNGFVPAAVPGYSGPYSAILAGLGYSPNTGFFIDPLVGHADPANTGADGVVGLYYPSETFTEVGVAANVTVTTTPLPSTWTMLIAGFVGLGFIAYRGKKNRCAAIAAA